LCLFQPDYEDLDLDDHGKHKLSVVVKALSSMKRPYNVVAPAPYEIPTMSRSAVGIYEMEATSACGMAESMEVEQQIYETPCENEENIGPVYLEPPSDERKIYEEF